MAGAAAAAAAATAKGSRYKLHRARGAKLTIYLKLRKSSINVEQLIHVSQILNFMGGKLPISRCISNSNDQAEKLGARGWSHAGALPNSPNFRWAWFMVQD